MSWEGAANINPADPEGLAAAATLAPFSSQKVEENGEDSTNREECAKQNCASLLSMLRSSHSTENTNGVRSLKSSIVQLSIW